jgi:hypothetical protein
MSQFVRVGVIGRPVNFLKKRLLQEIAVVALSHLFIDVVFGTHEADEGSSVSSYIET